ncbi:FH4 [Symbiodinium microadriaticum]|nr:FH4 [Symbiodinium microadriaticum]
MTVQTTDIPLLSCCLCHQDIDSKATTIKHLQSALDAKSQTINILSKANKNQNKDGGGSLETYIEEVAEEMCKSKLAAKDTEVNRLMELLHDLEERQSTQSGSQPSKAEAQRLEEELEELRRSNAAALAPLREQNEALTEQVHALKEQAQQSASQLSQFREYQSKAFELKSANDALNEQLDAVNEEIQQMQAEHKEELDQLQKELSTLQSDRQAHHQAVAAQIDSKVKAIRLSLESEKQSLEQELEDARENARVQLQAVSSERDHLQLRLHAQEVEVQALRDAVGSVPECEKQSEEQAESQPRRVVQAQQVERAKALREQSQFAFDEMTRHLAEIREAGETERKRLQADLDQQLKQRAAALLEVQNERDSLQTQAEALEQANKAVSLQRDEIARQLREKERINQELADELEEQREQFRTTQQRYGVLSLVHSLQRSTVLPAFSLLRRALPPGGLGAPGPGRDPAGPAGPAGPVEEASYSDAESDDSYGLDDRGQQEFAQLMKDNTFESLFVGADRVSEDATAVTGELQEHMTNIVTSLELFPQMHTGLMQELDKRGFGRELRKFLLLMQRAVGRSVRMASTMAELTDKHANVNVRLKNLLGSKKLEWHMKSLRMSGQHEVLLRFQRNQTKALKADLDDVLEQLGDQCEQNRKVKQELEDARLQLEASKGTQEEELRIQLEASKDSEARLRSQSLEKDLHLREVREQLDAAQKQIQTLEALQAEGADRDGAQGPQPQIEQSLEGSGPRPGPPQGQEDADSVAEPTIASASASGKGQKGKKGPPKKGPPPQGESEPSAVPTPTLPEEDATATPAPKGKGKKGPGPPPPKASQEPAAEEPSTTEDAATAEEPKAKAKGKGKKGPPGPPPAKASPETSEEPSVTEEAAEQQASAVPSKGKGKKGPPMPGKGGPGPAPGPSCEENSQSAEGVEGAAPKKGKPAPPKGGPKGKAAGKGKTALPDVDPGPEPPKHLVGKKFHWTNVVGTRFAGSMFQQIVESLNSNKTEHVEAEPDDQADTKQEPERKPKMHTLLEKLTGTFFKSKEEPPDAAGKDQKEARKKTVAQCLPPKKSQAVEIFLNGCGVNIDHVRRCVLDLDAENLSKVIELYPKGDELQELMDFKKDNDPTVLPWARAEEFLIQLMDISDFKVRAECCLTRGMFSSECDEVERDLTTLHAALTDTCKCENLRKIFTVIMQIGNYLNHGTNKGAQRGFTLDTLPLLSRVEGFEGKAYSLLRFIMDEVDVDVKAGAMLELKFCEEASKLDFDESVRRLSEMQKQLAILEEALGPPGDGEGEGKEKPSRFGEHFEAEMRSFLTDAKLRVSKLQQQSDEVQELSKTSCDLFAEKPRTPAPETLGKLAAFRKVRTRLGAGSRPREGARDKYEGGREECAR